MTDHLRRHVRSAVAAVVNGVTVVRRADAGATFAAAGDAGSPGDVSTPDVTRASRDVTADDILDRIRELAATDDSFDHRLIGWLASRAPEIVWAVLDDMETFAATHDGDG